MNGMTTKEAAEKWGVTPRQVQLMCANGRIPGAVRFGHAWVIPSGTAKPEDRRLACGRSKDNGNSDGE